MAAILIAASWVIANILFYFFGNAAVNFIAPVQAVILAIFFFLARSKSLNGAFIHRVFFIFYSLYFAINSWHLTGRIFFPQTLVANYWFSLAASNGVFVLMVVTLWFLAILKFFDNYADGGLMGVYERNIGAWRRWFGGG
ncbi:MAG: hypothetical protein HKN14_06650 [Marinicaulis sp.]|nr:hypothetical protein [Marinicaulis sp.]NNE40582.1 hypothetical protein [Marinicaulis sp.]NNL88196.1 hypothetical protein [Marinicaulis sp.]